MEMEYHKGTCDFKMSRSGSSARTTDDEIVVRENTCSAGIFQVSESKSVAEKYAMLGELYAKQATELVMLKDKYEVLEDRFQFLEKHATHLLIREAYLYRLCLTQFYLLKDRSNNLLL